MACNCKSCNSDVIQGKTKCLHSEQNIDKSKSPWVCTCGKLFHTGSEMRRAQFLAREGKS